MGDEEGSPSLFRPDGEELLVEAIARHFIQCAERFVEQQHARLVGERASERDAFALATGELAREELGEAVEPGQNIGWVEGFKAASDVYCVMNGSFVEGNPYLKQDACVVRSDPYEVGWLYAVKGQPEADHLDVHGYIEYLSGIIHKMAEEGHGEESAEE